MTRGRYGWALAVVAVSAFMITMDNTVVHVALPVIRDDLQMSSGTLQWVATGYILMFSCLMIAGGRLADVYGCRAVLITGMAIFTGSSLIAGVAPDGTVLIAARVVQGAGAALALPSTLVIVTVGRTDKQKSLGTIVFLASSSVAIAIGPFVGGFIASHWHWGWIFLINVVPGIAVMLLAAVVVSGRPEQTGTRLDLPGVLTSAIALFAFTYGLDQAHRHGLQDPTVLAVFGLAGSAALAFVLVERWAPDPMINLEFFRNRVFTGGLVTQMLWGIGFNGVLFYTSFFLQDVLGFAPTKTGLVFLPPAILLLLMTPVSFWLAERIGPRISIGGGMCVLAAGMASFTVLRPGDGLPQLMPGVLVLSAGAAMAMPLAMYVLKSVPEERAGVASGILNVVREVSVAFGIAVLGVIIAALEKRALAGGADKVEAFRHAVSFGLLIGGGLVLAGGLIVALTLPRRSAAPVPARQPLMLGPAAIPLPARGAGGRWRSDTRRGSAGRWIRDAQGEGARRAGLRVPPPPPPEGWHEPYIPPQGSAAGPTADRVPGPTADLTVDRVPGPLPSPTADHVPGPAADRAPDPTAERVPAERRPVAARVEHGGPGRYRRDPW
ncbi:MFS transporter [Actinomadura craniellae]|uniref:MFS transporter n=1 Tax=Actinomadura craniellae TaxID=2231787 RepID=UPI001F3FFC87|nr:MFS transporter [Actinomadura craniellae]